MVKRAHSDTTSSSPKPCKRSRSLTAVKTEPGNGETELPKDLNSANLGSPSPVKLSLSQLSEEQKKVVNLVLPGFNVCYTGPAGCGKSTVTGVLVRRLRQLGKQVRIVAPTGLAALNVGGTTIHTFAGWRPEDFQRPISKLEEKMLKSFTKDRIFNTDTLVIDEISMVSSETIERLDTVMKVARKSTKPFGGVQVIVAGDFCQLGPVKPFEFCLLCGKEREVIVSKKEYECPIHGKVQDNMKWAFNAGTFKAACFKHVLLKQVFRQSDHNFQAILDKLWLSTALTTDELDLLTSSSDEHYESTKLFPTKREVEAYNSAKFEALDRIPRRFTSIDEFLHNPMHGELKDKGRRSRHDHQLIALQNHRYEPVLNLKVGMPVLLLTNTYIDEGLVNGSRGKIVGFEDRKSSRVARPNSRVNLSENITNDRNEKFTYLPEPVLRGDHSYRQYEQLKEFLNNCLDKAWPVVQFDSGPQIAISADCCLRELGDIEPYSLLMRTQIPLVPAWALTVHKSQGMTLGEAEVDVSKTFESGQAYVAISRVRSLEGLRVKGLEKGGLDHGGDVEVHRWLMDTFPELKQALGNK